MRFRPAPIAALGSAALFAMMLSISPVEAEVRTPSRADTAEGAAGEASEKTKPKRFCKGKRATIVGNKRANRIIGTNKRDIIWAGGGADSILGRGGKDLICGGRGADLIVGNAGRDRLYGGPQRDLCTGERREHRHHYSCEVHLNLKGRPVNPPNAPGKMKALDALPVPDGQVPDPLVTGPGSRKVGTYFASDAPLCSPDGSALTTVHLGKVYFQTYYTNPGYIAIRPSWYRFLGNGFWSGVHYDGGWTVTSAPADGQVWSQEMFARLVPRSDRVFWVYEVFWWNGAQWVDGSYSGVTQTWLNTSPAPIATGPLCWV